jgi:hypothetical protein
MINTSITNKIHHLHACGHIVQVLVMLRLIKQFTKLMHEGMPNNSIIWGNPHLN